MRSWVDWWSGGPTEFLLSKKIMTRSHMHAHSLHHMSPVWSHMHAHSLHHMSPVWSLMHGHCLSTTLMLEQRDPDSIRTTSSYKVTVLLERLPEKRLSCIQIVDTFSELTVVPNIRSTCFNS